MAEVTMVSVPMCRYDGSPMDEVIADEYVDIYECPECCVLLSHSNETDDYTWYKPEPPDKWQLQRLSATLSETAPPVEGNVQWPNPLPS